MYNILSLLMLGPGTSITHAAINVLAENGCLVIWAGEHGIRFYAMGLGKTRSSAHLLHQAFLVSHPELRIKVIRKMYQKRFEEKLDKDLTLQQIRGKEGARVRKKYEEFSEKTNVEWNGRNYNVDNWNKADTINRAISAGNACLYGICHAAIVSIGFSTGLGFIHTGKLLSFVYDIADLYKFETTIPLAFKLTSEGNFKIAKRVRIACRDQFFEKKILKRIVPDIQNLLSVEESPFNNLPFHQINEIEINSKKGIPGGLWDPEEGSLRGGKNFDDT